jgi:hypothetical protein
MLEICGFQCQFARAENHFKLAMKTGIRKFGYALTSACAFARRSG